MRRDDDYECDPPERELHAREREDERLAIATGFATKLLEVQEQDTCTATGVPGSCPIVGPAY
jgi:hypothetical protein